MFRLLLLVGCICVIAAIWSIATPAQEGVGEQIGRKIDQGLTQIGDELRQGWASMRESVDRLGVQGRVYGRLHWDKQLVNANLEIGMQGNDVVILKGTVPTMAAKTAAGRLAEETIGVQSVVNELVVSGAGR